MAWNYPAIVSHLQLNGGGMPTGSTCGGNGVQNGVQCSSPVWHTPPSPSTGCVMTAIDGNGANYTSPVYFQVGKWGY